MGCNSSKDSGWMGCNSLKVNDSEVVRRCRKRKQMMSDAVKYRQEFALAHLAYIQTLRDVGYALCQFSDRQLSDMEVMPPSSQVLSTSQTSVVAAKPPSIPPTPPSNLPAKHEKPLPRSFLPLQQQAPTYLDSDANHSSSTIGVNLTREDHDRRVSPVRSGGSSPAFYSPLRELPSDVLMASVPASPFRSLYYPPSQPSSPQSSAWDPFNLFSSPLPFHSQKHMISDVQGLEQDQYQADNSMREEGMPDLEEDEQNDDGKEQPEPSRPSGEQNHGKVISMEISENVAVTLTEISEDEVLNKINEKQAGMAEATLVGKKPNNIQGDEIQAKRELASTMMERVKELTEFVGRLDDAFGRASESGQKVSEMLETQMVYSHESIVDYSDLFRFGNTITWHWSRKAAPQQEGIDDTSNVVRHDTGRSHSLTLERLYTWEKKLYKEVKAGEQLHVAFSRKRKEFNSLDAKGKDSNLMEQTRAALKSLDSRLMVTFKAISSASTRIQQVTNDELYPQLVELSARLKNMWKEMLECHTTQEAFAQEIQIHEKPGARFAASDSHRNSTINLEQALERWQQNFHWWVNSQQKYIHALLTWIRICHMEPEAHMKGGALSPARTMGRPPIHLLARNWHDSLVCLEENMEVVAAIKRFAGMVHDLQLAQLEELTQMKHAEMLTKGVDRRSLSFRHMERREEGQQHTHHEDQVGNMKAALEREDTTFSTLQQHLPNIFKALTTFSAVAFREYENIHKGITPTHTENPLPMPKLVCPLH